MRTALKWVLLSVLFTASCRGHQSVIEDFEADNLDRWIVEGNAFVFCPKNIVDYPGITGVQGSFFAASDLHDISPSFCGMMTSRAFLLSQNYLCFRLGGTSEGPAGQSVAIELLVDGAVIKTAHPQRKNPNVMGGYAWDVQDLKGRRANIRIRVDSLPGSTNVTSPRFILVDQIVQSNKPVPESQLLNVENFNNNGDKTIQSF